MFIRWSGILFKSNPYWHWQYKYYLTSCSPLLFMFERALPSSSDPLVPELQSSLKATAYSLRKKERDVDTINERATHGRWQQTATMLPSTEDAFKQHVFVPNFIHWFGARATSQTKNWSNQLVVAGQLAMMGQQCIDSSILYIQTLCGCREVLLPAGWTIVCRCMLLYKLC